MYDYVDGKVDWMAAGLPVEGEDGPFLGSLLTEATTIDVRRTVADAHQALSRADGEETLLVTADGLVVGDLDDETLEGKADDASLLEVMRVIPDTVRPSVTVAAVAEGGGGTLVVTDSDGRLLGLATVEGTAHDHEHEHGHDHDHEGHADDGPSADEQRYEQELAAVMSAVEERFGDAEPPADELRAFLRGRLLAEGRSVEEAEHFLEGLEDSEAT
ncbi:MAG: hypothetical protein ACR2MO_01140 [Acidimicrobiales bacterium]